MNRERVIESIFNYCTRRCELCPFTENCTLYQSEREYEQSHPDVSNPSSVHDSFTETFRLLEEWCRREGIDFDEIRRDVNREELRAGIARTDDAVRSDPLQKLATAYGRATLSIADAMASARAMRRWSEEVETALDTLTWHAGMVGAKVHRALHGLVEEGHYGKEDPVQNDWNGSAKLARIIVHESQRAWRVMLREGEAPDNSPLLELVGLLERIDEGLAERFPRAMEFVRPGFDEPAATRVVPTNAV